MKRKTLLIIMSAVCCFAVAGMVLSLTLGKRSMAMADFTPPPFDESAQAGMPQVDDGSLTKVYKDGMSFTAYVCGNVTVHDAAADLWFVNDAQNNVWLKLRIVDQAGNILGQTGLIKPNQYVKTVRFDTVPANGTKIALKIMAYEPDTYYSAGAVYLNTTLNK